MSMLVTWKDSWKDSVVHLSWGMFGDLIHRPLPAADVGVCECSSLPVCSILALEYLDSRRALPRLHQATPKLFQ